ncbi:alpha/beta hydrolase [Frigoriflavimonas asaccharolytica]|uniref:Acetyl esterase/lipase n=1 Tax=Frigoriflavimonas asaccharolytica TaxID=2735899 RepID=A0A8J8G6C2_9FLAO|nr:alpha/beta hydrolase [Frigoriflavimonas asaccharolytica]NRS91535.1 acetyl esterase/lipase [Frigoriflavimonas asaccharolytica]
MKKLFFNYIFWFLGLLSFALQSCTSQYKIWVGENNEQKIYNLKYGEEKKQNMDVFLPAYFERDRSAVVIVHGGAWKRGRKQKMIMIQNYLHSKNIPTININYRLVRKGITYKDQLEDIESAIKKFNEFSTKTLLPEDNFIILGESAGAHLALLYGYQNPQLISKIISLSGPTDFYTPQFLATTYSRYALPTIQDVVGEKFNRKKIPESFKIASPIYQVSNVPTLLFQGDQDLLVNRKQGLALDSVLFLHKVDHKLIYMMKTGHVPRFFSKEKREKIILPEILKWIRK